MNLKKAIKVFAICVIIVTMLSACGANEKELIVSGENSFPAPTDNLDDELVVMTYNIKNCENGKSITAVASDIKKYNPDVVCVQEVDNGTRRSKKQDVLKLLAQELKMNYCFYPAINLEGGLYGIGIMSVFPLENCQMQPLEIRNGDEARVLASADIKTPKKTVHLFNTHLSFEDKETRLNQIKWLNDVLKDKDSFVLTGDFNIESFDELTSFNGMSAVNTEKNPLESYIGNDGNNDFFRAIDNILVSNDIELDDITFGETTVSDHRPLIAEIEL